MSRWLVALMLIPAALSPVAATAGDAADELPVGTIVARVSCVAAPTQSYACCLPAAYTPDRTWPIVYAFDAGARGSVPVELFRAGADQFGFIVVGSNNSRNGPWEPIQAAIDAVWQDTHARFPIATGQVYTAGFSGGARVACEVGFVHSNEVAGVIGCSGTFSPSRRPAADLPFVFFGTAGTQDFNRPELEQMAESLTRLGVPNRAAFFEGGHAWAPAELCREALEWMALRAMRDGLRAVDRELADQVGRRVFAEAAAKEQDGRPAEAYAALKGLSEDLRGLADLAAIESERRRLGAREDVREALAQQEAERRRREALEAKFRARLGAVSEELQDEGRRMGVIEELKRDAEQGSESDDGRIAAQLLQQIYVSTNVGGLQSLRQGNVEQGVRRLEVAVAIQPTDGTALYNLACAYSLSGRADDALAALEKSIANGFTNLDHARQDPDLAPLHGKDAFRALVGGPSAK